MTYKNTLKLHRADYKLKEKYERVRQNTLDRIERILHKVEITIIFCVIMLFIYGLLKRPY